jgi:cytochrome c oxidase cbb3-type subunit 3
VSNDNVDQVLGHADECDGIEEYDNRLPRWWLGLFYICMGWGVVYAVQYHFLSDRSQAADYDAEVALAEEMWPTPSVEEAAAAATGADAIAAGKAIYATNCVGCHGPELKGGIGPDLTDDVWIHGGSLESITQTVTNGIPEKGMLAWGPILGPQKVAEVSAFVHGSGGGL